MVLAVKNGIVLLKYLIHTSCTRPRTGTLKRDFPGLLIDLLTFLPPELFPARSIEAKYRSELSPSTHVTEKGSFLIGGGQLPPVTLSSAKNPSSFCQHSPVYIRLWSVDI